MMMIDVRHCWSPASRTIEQN